MLDRVAAVILAIVSAPLVLALALAVRLGDGGRGLITVDRVGRNGRVFRMWKIRSMRSDGARADGGAGGAALTGADDSRITSIGRRIRSYHLDELPQLWNVVRGDMLLLGPRPEAPAYVDVDDAAWKPVLQAPPGIAGPTQLVVGEWERATLHLGESFYISDVLPVKLRVDAWYLQKSTPILDLFVLGSLFGRFTGHGGWRLRRHVVAQVPEIGATMETPGSVIGS